MNSRIGPKRSSFTGGFSSNYVISQEDISSFMKGSKHPHFENPTIIETVIKVQLLQTIGKSEQECLEGKLSSKYPCTKDELVVYSAAFNPSGISLQQDRPGQKRLKFQLGEQVFVHFYPDKFSFHWLGKYPGWSTIQCHFKKFCKQLFNLENAVDHEKRSARF